MINGRICLITFAVLLLFTATAFALSGREIYDRVHDVRTKALDRKIEATMTLFDKGGGKRSRTLTEYGKNAAPEACKVLVVFNSPADLKGVGFLIHARTFADRDLWAYFPEYKRVRRIPTSSQDDSFFGSDFTYDDFSGPSNLNDFSYKVLKEEVVDGKPCYVVEVTPKTHRKYSRYVAWIAKDYWVHIRIEYYQDKELYRKGNFREIRLIDGVPTPFRIEMENLKSSHRTLLTMESVSYRARFPDDLFTQRSLERGVGKK
jgi:outer membrane lipoprotein-sorting protein